MNEEVTNKYQKAAIAIREKFEEFDKCLIAEHTELQKKTYYRLLYDDGIGNASRRIKGLLEGIAKGNITVGQSTLGADMELYYSQCHNGFVYKDDNGYKTWLMPDSKVGDLARDIINELFSSGLAAERQSLEAGFVKKNQR